MLPMSSSSNHHHHHHSHIEPSWKTYYDAKKLLRQTEQRLKETREYYPHVHLNNNNNTNHHQDNNNLSILSSSPASYLHHGGDTSSIHAGNRTMLNDDRIINNKHQLLDSEALQTIRRKISKQKIAAERRAEQLFQSQSDVGHMFESYRPHSAYSTSASLQNLHYSPHRQQRLSPPKPQISYTSHLSQSQSFPSELDNVLRHSTSSRILQHKENDFERQSYHQPTTTTRKTTKITPKDNYSLSNGRSTQQRSASATTGLTTKYQDLPSSHYLTSSDNQRLKHVAHVLSSANTKPNLITPDSWRTDPIVTKKSSIISQQEKSLKKKTAAEIISKRTKTDIEESLGHINQRTDKIIKSKRDTSATKPSVIITEKTPLKPSSKPISDDEKKKLQEYIQQKRQQHEEIISNEKRLKDEQDKIRKDKFKKYNEQQIKDIHQQQYSSKLTSKDLAEQTRQRLLGLLGSSTDYHINSTLEQPSLVERSSSSSSSISSSNDSLAEIQLTKPNDQVTIRCRSEPPFQNDSITNNVQRHDNLLRWAVNLTRDCDIVENRFKYLRSDGTQSFDIIPSSYQQLQHDDGNIRYQTTNSETIKSSTLSRLSGRLNSNRLTDYQNHPITNINDHRDLLLERRIYRDRAAAKIQAAYRGYTVRKSLPWFNEKQRLIYRQYHRRPLHYREPSSINNDINLSNNNLPIDSTLIRYYENTTINDYQQQNIRKITTLPFYTDDYDNVPNISLSNLSTPNNHKQIQIIKSNLSLDLPSTNSSSSTTPVPSPEPHIATHIGYHRSISPPLPPQMSPDNGRPLHFLTQTTNQQPIDENIESIERSKSASRVQNLSTEQQARRSPVRKSSSSSSSSTATNRKRRSPSPQQQQTTTTIHSRHRNPQNLSPPTSSSESILTAREKRVRQKFNSDIELQAYEKRLKDIEKKIRQLVKRAFEIFDEKRSISSPPTIARTTKTTSKSTNHLQDESSISEDVSNHRKDNELIKKDSDTSSISNHQKHSDIVTSDASDLERRVRAYREQLKAKKLEFERLTQRKNKEILRRQEDELKRQIESYDQEIQTLRLQPIQQEQTVPITLINNNSLTEKIKSNEKEIISSKQNLIDNNNEEKEIESRPVETPRDERDTQHDALSISTTADLLIEPEPDYHSRRSSIDNEKSTFNLHTNLPVLSKEKEDSISSSSTTTKSEKPIKLPSPQISKSSSSSSISEKPIKSPSPQVSQSSSSSSSTTTSEKPIKPPSPKKSKSSSSSSSSTASEKPIKPPSPPSSQSKSIKSPLSSIHEHIKSPTPPISIPILEQKESQITSIKFHEYDEDFSEVSHSPINPPPNIKIDELDIDSIQEDIEKKPSLHDTNHSSTSKSSADEQSEILVLVKKSANNTPRQQDDELPPIIPIPIPPTSIPLKIESDDTSRDVSDDEDNNIEQENQINKLTETFIRTFIDEAIDHGKDIENLKNKASLTKEASEWMSDEDLTDEETNKQIPISHEEDVDNAIQTLSNQPEFLEQLDTTTNGANEQEDLKLDLSRLEDKNLDEPRIESPRKIIIEESIKPVVSHTREKVIELCHQAINILYQQNTDFSNRTKINRTIPDYYFNYDQQDSDNEDIRRSRYAYCRMIFDLCVELLHEMYSSNVRIRNYPEWEKTKLISKRFYRLNKPKNRDEAEKFIELKILEILNLTPHNIIYSKWRMPIIRHHDIEQFEIVLNEELRRTETQWIDYEDDCTKIKFDIADYIFEQLIQETLTECFHVINKRLLLSSK